MWLGCDNDSQLESFKHNVNRKNKVITQTELAHIAKDYTKAVNRFVAAVSTDNEEEIDEAISILVEHHNKMLDAIEMSFPQPTDI